MTMDDNVVIFDEGKKSIMNFLFELLDMSALLLTKKGKGCCDSSAFVILTWIFLLSIYIYEFDIDILIRSHLFGDSLPVCFLLFEIFILLKFESYVTGASTYSSARHLRQEEA
jgi:hypothetical protein